MRKHALFAICLAWMMFGDMPDIENIQDLEQVFQMLIKQIKLMHLGTVRPLNDAGEATASAKGYLS